MLNLHGFDFFFFNLKEHKKQCLICKSRRMNDFRAWERARALRTRHHF